MKYSLFNVLIMLLILFNCSAQSGLESSSEYIHTFEKIESTVLAEQIKSIADSSRIVGLGEVSHYTKECYELKHEIIKTLITSGYDGLVLEVDFGQALIWNKYVTKGEGDLDAIIANSGWFTYRTEEFKNLIRDIRTHNENAKKPFQIFGMEMTAMNHNIDWLKSYFRSNVEENKEILKILNTERKIVAFYNYSTKERTDYWSLFNLLSDFIKTNEKELLEKGGEQSYDIANRITEITRQYATYISQDDFSLKLEFRDQFSARNVYWILNELGEESKIAIWAHNGHVAKENVMADYDILGHYLAKWFGEKYYSIGFTFNKGEFGAFSNNGFKIWKMPAVNRTSITEDLEDFKQPFLIFDIRKNLKSDQNINSYLRTEHLIRRDISESYDERNGEYMDIDLSKTYDALIYIDKTSAPTAIDWKE